MVGHFRARKSQFLVHKLYMYFRLLDRRGRDTVSRLWYCRVSAGVGRPQAQPGSRTRRERFAKMRTNTCNDLPYTEMRRSDFVGNIIQQATHAQPDDRVAELPRHGIHAGERTHARAQPTRTPRHAKQI